MLVGGTDNSLTSEMPILEFDVEAEAWIERTESLGNKRYSQAGVVVDSSVTICA